MVGLHLRIKKDPVELIDKAQRLNLSFFQAFLTSPNAKHFKRYFAAQEQIAVQFKRFDKLYAHASYFINIASNLSYIEHSLYKELEVAAFYGFTHFIIHPGCYDRQVDYTFGINTAARVLNKTLKKQKDITIVLENSAHGKRSLGGNLEDLALIYSKLDYPEKVAFCIDTAHAHVFGHNLTINSEQDSFIESIGQLLGFDKLALLHVNDAFSFAGSQIDRHTTLGQGTIGLAALQRFISNPAFKNIPLLMELPPLPETEELALMLMVNSWRSASASITSSYSHKEL